MDMVIIAGGLWEYAGVNYSATMIGTGKNAIRPEILLSLCRCLNVSSDYILTGERSDRDISAIAEKLRSAAPDKLQSIEQIIDLCVKISE